MSRILLVDDQPVVAGGLGTVFREHSFDLVGRAIAAAEVGQMIGQYQPHVLVSEARLQGIDLIGTLADAIERKNAPVVVVFSAIDDLTHIARAAAIGVYEYVLKSSPIEKLVQVIEAACRRAPASESGLIAQARGRLRRPRQPVREDVPLTRRELQVLQHVALGLSNREIGTSLEISIETAKEHVQNILRKLNVNDRTQAAVWAVRRNLA
jgi:DNA-binding NarL/FixJ family response regulator